MRLLIHFSRYGPYHHARLRAAHEVLAPLGWEVMGLEIAGNDATYAWDEQKSGADGPKVVTAFPGRIYEQLTAAEYRRALLPLLDSLMPDAMAIAGWGSADALMCLSWCRKNDRRRIVMSETRAADGRRIWFKELAKRFIISRFNGALVGGKSHRDYLVSLGMKSERIAFGYNVVDNEYFAEKTQDYKTQDAVEERRRQGSGVRGGEADPSLQLSTFNDQLSPYFLASNRFIERKNLLRLIEAYCAYAHRSQKSGARHQNSDGRVAQSSVVNHSPSPWPLVLLGDGEQKPALIARCKELGLTVIESAPWEISSSQSAIGNQLSSFINEASASSLAPDPCPPTSGSVFFPGFRQVGELPRFYAHAGCFIHPALEEPWGLVINEAMACGLPVLSSYNVGAAEELVEDGVNGWKFDPHDTDEMTRRMAEISASGFPVSDFATASLRILDERCPTRCFGEGLALLLQ